MTSSVELESALRSWMDAEAPVAVPDDLLATVLSQTAGTRQRPAWLPRLDLPSIPTVPLRMVWLLALILLLIAAMAGALLVGQSPTGPASVENGLIAFIGRGAGERTWSEDGRGSDVYLVAPDGSGLTRLTETTAVEWDPAWSPDGTRLAFIREVTAAGGPPEGVDCEADPAACERGTTPGEYAVLITNAAPGAERVVFQSTGVINSLVWSPDGSRLSFNHERSGGLVALDLATGSTRLALPGSYDVVAWAPDGTGLVTQGIAAASGADLYLVFIDDREPIRLTRDVGYEGWPAWSPDGSHIAFSFDPDGSARAHRIEVMAPDGSGRSVLAEDAYGPAWSPDGALIAFVKTFGDPTGRSNEVWVMAPDGSGQRKLADGGSKPSWSPDGELVFWRGDEGTWSIRPDGSALTKLPTGGVSLGEGLADVDWQAVRP